MPYLYNRFLDKQYDVRREDDGRFLIGSFHIVDNTSDTSTMGIYFKGLRAVWELLTRKNINRGFLITEDQKRYDYLTVDQRSVAGIRIRG
jgi:hypothetical protein